MDKEIKKIELGGGDSPYGCGFLNVDVRALPTVDIVADIRSLPFENESIEEIFTSNVLEHFNYNDVVRILEESYRVLKTGGKIIQGLYNKDMFKQNYFDHIFSEHFFEHLFLDESIELFREIYRILKPKGVMRTVVPDADLRPVPEKIGFPGDQYSWSSQRKHKTRWSRYSLLPVLELTGFKVIPLRYYDKEGNLYNQIDNLPLPDHNRLLDIQILSEIRHIKRKNSLIVDAVK